LQQDEIAEKGCTNSKGMSPRCSLLQPLAPSPSSSPEGGVELRREYDPRARWNLATAHPSNLEEEKSSDLEEREEEE